MALHLPKDTSATLGDNAVKCESRSLLLERFADPGAKEEARRKFFERAIAKPALSFKRESWKSFLSSAEDVRRGCDGSCSPA